MINSLLDYLIVRTELQRGHLPFQCIQPSCVLLFFVGIAMDGSRMLIILHPVQVSGVNVSRIQPSTAPGLRPANGESSYVLSPDDGIID
jgi:hypothetical protein